MFPDRDAMTDLPEDFYSEYSGRPFETCIDCEGELLCSDTPYLIIKQVVARETVFEMAICLPCAISLQQEYSEESRQAIHQWIASRTSAPPSDSDAELTPGNIDQCHLCQTPRTEAHRYTLEALCVGDQIVQTGHASQMIALPLLICENCTADVSELISRKTRDQWNRFVEDHFDGPPGLEVDPIDSDLLFVS